MTDTSTRRPAHDTASRWERRSPLHTAAELSLGLSFTATVASAGYSAVTGHLAVVAQVTGALFLLTLMIVVVSWFRAVEREDTPVAGGRARATPVGATLVEAAPTSAATAAPATSAPAPAPAVSAADLAAIDAEYRR